MRSLKIKGCNYILLAAVNLSLKQIIMMVSFWRKASSEKKRRDSFRIEACKKATKELRHPPKDN